MKRIMILVLKTMSTKKNRVRRILTIVFNKITEEFEDIELTKSKESTLDVLLSEKFSVKNQELSDYLKNN